jgi:hypothetical protein
VAETYHLILARRFIAYLSVLAASSALLGLAGCRSEPRLPLIEIHPAIASLLQVSGCRLTALEPRIMDCQITNTGNSPLARREIDVAAHNYQGMKRNEVTADFRDMVPGQTVSLEVRLTNDIVLVKIEPSSNWKGYRR